jgi:hypothetical protein
MSTRDQWVYSATTGLPSGAGVTPGTYTLDGCVLTTTGISNIAINNTLTAGTLSVSNDAKLDGEVYFRGRKLSETIGKIEERLGILHMNEELELRWDDLKQLGHQYKKLEAELIEKEKVWSILKK